MADTVSPEKRSAIMRRVKSRDTKPELVVRDFLRRKGLRFRAQAADLPGRPDFIFPEAKTVVFVHGCFWHQHRACGKDVIPKTNSDYWRRKLSRNVERDRRNARELRRRGWIVVVLWECGLSEGKLSRLASLIRLLGTGRRYR